MSNTLTSKLCLPSLPEQQGTLIFEKEDKCMCSYFSFGTKLGPEAFPLSRSYNSSKCCHEPSFCSIIIINYKPFIPMLHLLVLLIHIDLFNSSNCESFLLNEEDQKKMEVPAIIGMDIGGLVTYAILQTIVQFNKFPIH